MTRVMLFDDAELDLHLKRQSTPTSPKPPQPKRSKAPSLRPPRQAIVVSWNQMKGYGFAATGADDEDDVFLKASALRDSGIDSLTRGDRIEYTPYPSRRPHRFDAGKIKIIQAAA